MRYKLKCSCGATAWCPGSYDPETNATELDEKQWHRLEWDGGLQSCFHEDFTIVDECSTYDPDEDVGVPYA